MDNVVDKQKDSNLENESSDASVEAVQISVCSNLEKKDNISYPEFGDVIIPLPTVPRDKTLEDLKNELNDILQQQAELEQEKKYVLDEIDELIIDVRNDFYAEFYNNILKLFKLKDDISQCIFEKDFNEYLKTLINQLHSCANRKVVLADEILFENLSRLIEATGIRVNKEDFESPELLSDICDEARNVIKGFRLANEKGFSYSSQVSCKDGSEI